MGRLPRMLLYKYIIWSNGCYEKKAKYANKFAIKLFYSVYVMEQASIALLIKANCVIFFCEKVMLIFSENYKFNMLEFFYNLWLLNGCVDFAF